MSNVIKESVELAQAGFASTITNEKGGLFNNGHIGVVKDLVFGLMVWDGAHWIGIATLDEHDYGVCQDAIFASSPQTFLWWDEFNAIGARFTNRA